MPAHPSLTTFSDWIIQQHGSDPGVEQIQVLEGAEAAGADLEVRLAVANRSYYHARVVLERREIQVGLNTEHRMVNEGIEEMILSQGGDLYELLGDELCDLGQQPLPMEHFFERPAFRFIVRLPLERPEALDDPALREQVSAVLKSCRILFQESTDSE